MLKPIQKLYNLFILFTCSILFICCHPSNKQLDHALRKAGDNRIELEQVLAHYKNDSLKLAAANFLIKNMPFHFGKEEYFLSPGGEKYRPDISRFFTADEVQAHCDSIRGKGYQSVSKNVFDITRIKSEYLIKNIDLAFEVWEKPWAKDVPFEEFCRYILPYRAQTEALSGLREELMKRYLPLLDSAGVTTPKEACIVINNKLSNEIRYQNTGNPFYPTVEETYHSGISQCDGLCNFGIHVMRAVGVPIAIDYIPLWTKMDLGHSWCSVWNADGFQSFGPGEENPGEHLPYFQRTWFRKPAKAYRKCFEHRLVKDPLEDGFVTYLKNPFDYDVTHEYWDTLITISIDSYLTFDKERSLIYLCTHNQGKWYPLAIGERNKTECIVPDTRGDNIFIIADSPDGNHLRYITHPFYVDTAGVIQELISDFSRTDSFHLPNNQRNRKNMSLSYWNKETSLFEEVPDYTEADTMTYYKNVPGNALLRFSGMYTGVNQRRVFFINNDSIAFY